MKKMLFPILMILMALTLISCSIEARRMEEGNVNYYIYPYLKFTLSNYLTYYEASVVEGAKLTSVSIPGFHHTDFGPMPIKVFKGFENPEDATSLKTVYIDVNIERIADDAFDHASSLESVITTGTSDGQYWAKLPSSLTRNGYHFHGWKVGDIIYDGRGTVALDPDSPVAVPYFIKLEHFDAVESTCSEEGNIEYWKCPECGKLFTDSYAENSVNSVTVPPTGHLYPLVHKVAVEPTCQREGSLEYWRCDRCMETFADEDGRIPLPDYTLDKVDHQSDGNIYYSETVHYHKCRWLCGTVMDEDEHIFSLWIIDTPATEHTKGLKHADCSECGYRKTVEIPEHDHFDYEPAAKVKYEATCLEGAYYLEKCGNPDCGEVLKVLIEEEPALGHRGTIYEFKDSTCTETGTLAHIWCDVCYAPYENKWSAEPMETIEIGLKPHDYSTLWTIGEDTHYHLCRSCGAARSDETAHVYKQVVDPKYLKYSSTCQHANQYIESCECGKEGTEIFESGEIGEHEYSIIKPFDSEYHYSYCKYCDAQDPTSKEKHSFIPSSGGKKCEDCNYEVTNTEGGFDVVVVDKTPRGELKTTGPIDTVWTFEFVNKRPSAPPDTLEWYLDGVLKRTDDVVGVDDYSSYAFSVEAPYPMTYRVMCRYSNERGAGSESVEFKGGAN